MYYQPIKNRLLSTGSRLRNSTNKLFKTQITVTYYNPLFHHLEILQPGSTLANVPDIECRTISRTFP